ncbi:uncharacterized protein [Nicotiana tomentosiformis]|uniref:uncharacterized protein n=1 Tax=Nicotiana tomentosiformis TaxID=4098 RepID=UPI00388CC50A
MLFDDDIVLIDEKREGVNEKLEVWRQALESKGLKLSRTKTEYLECKFSAESREAGMDVRLGSQVIPKREDESSRQMRMLRWMCEHTRMDKIRNEDIREKVGVAPIDDKMQAARLR